MKGREISYENVNGHKIAFDPRDISESEERIKQPKLTLMEEVLLLGLKDKQVPSKPLVRDSLENNDERTNSDRPRVFCRSGTTTSHTHCEDALFLSWPSGVA